MQPEEKLEKRWLDYSVDCPYNKNQCPNISVIVKFEVRFFINFDVHISQD